MTTPASWPVWQKELHALGREASELWEREGKLSKETLKGFADRARATGAPAHALGQFAEGLGLKSNPYPFARTELAQ